MLMVEAIPGIHLEVAMLSKPPDDVAALPVDFENGIHVTAGEVEASVMLIGLYGVRVAVVPTVAVRMVMVEEMPFPDNAVAHRVPLDDLIAHEPAVKLTEVPSIASKKHEVSIGGLVDMMVTDDGALPKDVSLPVHFKGHHAAYALRDIGASYQHTSVGRADVNIAS